MELIPKDVEQIVMGQILLDHKIMATAAQLLRAEHFGDDECREAYEACLSVWRSGSAVDLLTIAVHLQREQSAGISETMARMVGWTMRVSSPRNFDAHARIIRECFASRILRDAGEQLVRGTIEGKEYTELIAPATRALAQAAMAEDKPDVNAGTRAFELMNSSDKPVPTYLQVAGLDSLVWILPGNVVAIRADAGVGKTAFVLSVVMNLMPRIKPWFVSLEMPADELIKRALCQIAQVDIESVMVDRMTAKERERLAQAASTYAHILGTLEIDDTGSMTIDEFAAKAEHRVKNGAGLIVVDYAQLMSADRKLYANKVQELEAISMGIRSTARRLNVPVLCIVHVNKQGEDHGTIQFEKDAHVRMHLSRDGDHMTIDVLKNRNGRPGKITTPCVMRYGIVGRTHPPSWAYTPSEETFNIDLHPDKNHTPF
jgi:replicative DNA helicase